MRARCATGLRSILVSESLIFAIIYSAGSKNELIASSINYEK